MLKIVLLGFISALICIILVYGVGFIIYRKTHDDLKIRVGFAIATFVIDFIWIVTFFYVSCIEQTIWAVIRWMWIPLLPEVILLRCIARDATYEIVLSFIMATISGTIYFASLFVVPVQNLIYIHDMADVDVTYAVKSDEILAKMSLSIDNSVQNKDRYAVDAPEMRKVAGKDIAVYHIRDKKAEGESGRNSEYIPGYAIQEKDNLPRIIPKRIYYDVSYINSRDALRTVRREYPTLIIGKHKFDIDDQMNPYEVFLYRENLYSTKGEYGLIILDLKEGTCEKYPATESIPAWVDFKTTTPK